MKRVLVVGSAEQSAGGVSSVIKLLKKMPVWGASPKPLSPLSPVGKEPPLESPPSPVGREYKMYWLGTQIQRGYLWKLWYAVKGNVVAFFVMWRYSIVHMHTTPDKLGLLIQLPILLWAKVLRKKVILHLHVGNQLKTKKNGLFVFCLKRADRIVLLAKKWERLFAKYYPEVVTQISQIDADEDFNANDRELAANLDRELYFGTSVNDRKLDANLIVNDFKDKNIKNTSTDCEALPLSDNSACQIMSELPSANQNHQTVLDENSQSAEAINSRFAKNISQSKTCVIYNPCEVKPEVPFEEKKKVIMMAAWFNDNKAPDVLLRSLSLTLPRREGTKPYDKNALNGWKVMMLGNGEVERFQKMAEEMGLSDVVTFTGYVTGEERERYFREASIYCMCSYEEGFPMVVLESWMYGINVVTTPVGGLPDVIEEVKNCLTFDFGDAEGLARQLRRLMEDEKLRREMAEYSRRFVEECFSMERINKDLTALYDSLRG